MSAFTQSTGYLIAAAGPFAVGIVHDASGGWTVPLVMLLALSLPLFPIAAYVSKVRFVEDQLRGDVSATGSRSTRTSP